MMKYTNSSFGVSVSELAVAIVTCNDYFKKSMRQSTVNRLLYIVEDINRLGAKCYLQNSKDEKIEILSEITSKLSTIDFRISYLLKGNIISVYRISPIVEAISKCRTATSQWSTNIKKLSKTA